jgi:hypothetical protein
LGGILISFAFRRSAVTPFQLLVGLWICVSWAIPQATSGTSTYRAEAALLPIAILIGSLPRLLAGAIVVAAILVAVRMEVLFLRNTLI